MSKEDLHFNVFNSYSPGLSPVNATTLQFGLKLYLPIRNWLTFPYKIIGYINSQIKIQMLWAPFYNWNIVKGTLSLNTYLINDKKTQNIVKKHEKWNISDIFHHLLYYII